MTVLRRVPASPQIDPGTSGRVAARAVSSVRGLRPVCRHARRQKPLAVPPRFCRSRRRRRRRGPSGFLTRGHPALRRSCGSGHPSPRTENRSRTRGIRRRPSGTGARASRHGARKRREAPPPRHEFFLWRGAWLSPTGLSRVDAAARFPARRRYSGRSARASAPARRACRRPRTRGAGIHRWYRRRRVLSIPGNGQCRIPREPRVSRAAGR